ncbi:TPA: hypothetical protein ACIPBC_001649 [Salmonella enterica subsp. enterica serovar Saintpaul]
MNKFKGIRVIPSLIPKTFKRFAEWRGGDEEELYHCFHNYKEVERKPRFNRPGLYMDRIHKEAWYELEMLDGTIRAFSTEYEHQEWVWKYKYSHGDRILNKCEYEEMRRMFRLYNVPLEQQPDVYKASREYWHDKAIGRDMELCLLRSSKRKADKE